MTPGLTYYPVTKSLMNAVDHQLLLTALLGTFASLSLLIPHSPPVLFVLPCWLQHIKIE